LRVGLQEIFNGALTKIHGKKQKKIF